MNISRGVGSSFKSVMTPGKKKGGPARDRLHSWIGFDASYEA
jgi:hypothetical protein